ncbi:MAG: hypothetical protein IJ700_01365 [Bacteroidaceae bacterium]|nr:hypothetical protein [Bacteroidaceae bacterium]
MGTTEAAGQRLVNILIYEQVARRKKREREGRGALGGEFSSQRSRVTTRVPDRDNLYDVIRDGIDELVAGLDDKASILLRHIGQQGFDRTEVRMPTEQAGCVKDSAEILLLIASAIPPSDLKPCLMDGFPRCFVPSQSHTASY